MISHCSFWLALLVGMATAHTERCDLGWGDLSLWVNKSDAALFRHNTHLIANATLLSYTSTKGTYFRPIDVNRTVGNGWIRDRTLFADPDVGMRALTFREPSTRRAIIVFRGTDLGNDTGAIADRCADSMLWDGVPFYQLPPTCRQFQPAQLDYFGQAQAFVERASKRGLNQSHHILFTGHSLGAGLALLMAATSRTYSAGAVVFSTPPMATTLVNRTGLNVSSLDSSRYITMADANDPLVFEVNASAAGLPGQLCLWDGAAPRPADCADCFRHSVPGFNHLNLTRPSCHSCFMAHHAYANYYRRLVAAGTLPTCVAGNSTGPGSRTITSIAYQA